MTAVITYSELLGRSVVAVANAEEVGDVKNIVLNRSASHIERIQVAGRKRSPELVDWDRVQNVGTDAVMINSADAVHESRPDEPDDLYVRHEIEVIGADVTTSNGFAAGELNDLRIDTSSGAIVAAITSNGEVAAANIRSLGTFGLIID